MAKKELKPKPLYGVDLGTVANTFVVKKMNRDYDVLETYHVMRPSEIQKAQTCDCFAGLQQKHCRHKQIVEKFLQAQAVGTPRLYCFDRDYWE